MKSAQLVIACFWPNAHCTTLHPHLFRSPQTEYIAYKVAVYGRVTQLAQSMLQSSRPTAGTIPEPYAHNKRKYIFIIYRFVDAIFHVVYGTVHRVECIPIGRINHNDCIYL